ncbi:MAG: long-chain acyl-CoA synthetase [Frankiales bacterium]|nr:long-chain acyl-CoA synthetase [Frankiales bacterium]
MSLSLAAVLAEGARRYPARDAVVFMGHGTSYSDLWEQSRRYASVFASRGIGRGDRVALLLPNVPDFPRAYFGTLALGAVVVPVHALLTAEEIAFVLRDSGASLLVCAGPLLGEGAKGAELAGVPIVSVLGAGDAAGSGDTGIEALEALAADVEPVATYQLCEPDDDAVILYTSGTTGQPKGAVLTHLNLVMNSTLSSIDVIGLSSNDVILGCLPLFHIFGQICSMAAGFRQGATIVLLPKFDGATALDLIVEHEVTVFQGVPTMYIGLLEAAKADPRRPQLRTCVSGGAALPVSVIEQFKEVFGADIYEGYGLSETSPVATFNQPLFGRKAGTVGHPIWGVEVRIAAADVEDRIDFMPDGESGEVVIRGHNIMKGYHNNPEATKAAIVDGWFRTGDIGVRDGEGFIAIVDRKKDLIIRGGFNVYPRELEEILVRAPGVAQIAVIGLPDETHGESVCAVVIPEPGSDFTVDALLDYGNDKLGKHKRPTRVEVVDAFPLGPSGKVLKRELVARFRTGGGTAG